MRKIIPIHTSDLASALKSQTTHSTECRFIYRLQCVLLVNQGCSYQQVAKWFNESPRTIERWVQCAEQYGVDKLKDKKKMGRPNRLLDKQYDQLRTEVSNNPSTYGYDEETWEGKRLQKHLQLHYKVDLSVRQCQRLLHKLLPKTEVIPMADE